MILRLSKALLVLLIGILLLLVGIHNIADYDTNFTFVQHVMSMDTVRPETTLTWHALTHPAYHHAAFAIIIAVELTSGALCVWGAVRLWQARREGAPRFNAAKDVAVAGLVTAFALYLFVFMTIGGEWFQMWQSPTWNAQAGTFRFLATVGLVLLILSQRDSDLA